MVLSAEAKRSASLAAVCLQSTALAIVINISQHVLTEDHQPYKASSAVLITELGKLMLSAGLALREAAAEQEFERAKHTPVLQAKQLLSVVIEGKEQQSEKVSLPRKRERFPTFKLPSSSLPFSVACKNVWRQVFSPGIVHMAVPAVLFLTQNNLIYVAARNLSIPVFQISFQLKTVITALMAVIMLRRRYNAIQWASLFLLGIGVAAVQLGAHATPHATHSASESNNISSAHPTEEHSFLDADQLLGLSAVVISCFASAIAATYFELILKKTPAPDLPLPNKYQSLQTQDTTSIQHPPPLVPLHWRSSTSSTWDKIRNLLPKSSPSENAEPTSLWIRNVQLSLFSLVFSWWLSWWSSANATASGDSFFAGFNVFTWVVIFIQTVGGLLTALVIKYADNVAKGFALSASAVLTFALSIAFFDYQLTAQTSFGALIVLATAFSFECHAQVSATLVSLKAKYLPTPPSSPDSSSD